MLKELQFEGAPVLVTGGGQGIGRSACEALAELGAHIIVVSKTAENVKETEKGTMHVLLIPLKGMEIKGRGT